MERQMGSQLPMITTSLLVVIVVVWFDRRRIRCKLSGRGSWSAQARRWGGLRISQGSSLVVQRAITITAHQRKVRGNDPDH